MKLPTSLAPVARTLLTSAVALGAFGLSAALGQEAAPAEAAAEAAPAVAAIIDKGDVAWMMTATVLVLFMTVPGSPCSMAASCAPRTCSPSSCSARSLPR
jgi:Amt family ammonium transporter